MKDPDFCDCEGKALEVGSAVEKQRKIKYLKLPTYPEDFVSRQAEMKNIIALLTEHRFVSIKGPPGIGKSTLSQMLCHYFKDSLQNEMLTDGIAYINCYGLETVD